MKTKSDTEPITQFDPQLIDELLAGHSTPQAIQGLIESFTKTVLERALKGELTHHLGYEKHAKANTGNARNGTSRKTLKTKQGELEIAILRDRNATFEPQLVAKQQTRGEGFGVRGRRESLGGVQRNDQAGAAGDLRQRLVSKGSGLHHRHTLTSACTRLVTR